MSTINLWAEGQSCACKDIAVDLGLVAGISDPEILVSCACGYFAQFLICVLFNFSVSSALQHTFFWPLLYWLGIFKRIIFSRSNAFCQ